MHWHSGILAGLAPVSTIAVTAENSSVWRSTSISTDMIDVKDRLATLEGRFERDP